MNDRNLGETRPRQGDIADGDSNPAKETARLPTKAGAEQEAKANAGRGARGPAWNNECLLMNGIWYGIYFRGKDLVLIPSSLIGADAPGTVRDGNGTPRMGEGGISGYFGGLVKYLSGT